MVEVNTPILCDAEPSDNERPPLVAVLDNLNFHSNDTEWEEMAATINERFNLEDFSNLTPKRSSR